MKAKAYVLLDIKNSKVQEAAYTLRNMRGVRIVDLLEGSPNMVVVVQARSRQQLADLTNKAIASVESITQDIQLLPTQNGYENDENKKHQLPVRR